jgi:MFS family permease
MFTFGLLTILLGKDQPQLILIAFLCCFATAALGDGIVSVPWAVLAGTSLDRRWRARLYGFTTASVGLIMLAVSPLIGLLLGKSGPGFPTSYGFIFVAAGLVFALSILPLMFVHELPGGKVSAKTPTLREFLPSLPQILRSDTAYRAMLVTRMLTSLFAMATPFYIGFATVRLGLSSTVAVPTLLATQTVGSVTGALVYTRLGARHNVLFIRTILALASLLPLSALLTLAVGPLPLYFGFLVLGLTLGNLASSYQNWLITHATPDQRPIYVGLFNTVAAIISLIAPLIGGTIAQQVGYEALFVVAFLMALSALFVTLRFVANPPPAEPLPVPAAD